MARTSLATAAYASHGERLRAPVEAMRSPPASQRLLPAKTRVFVDFIVEEFQRQKLKARFSAA
jgi:hypothetical protein